MEQWYLYKKKADFNQIGEKFNIDPVISTADPQQGCGWG